MSSTDTPLTRSFRVQYQNEYKIGNISLVSKYIIPKVSRYDSYKIDINGVVLDESYSDKENIYFDFARIREELRDIIPMTKQENDMSALETTLAYNSLCAMNAYKTLPKSVFNNTIFTNQDLCVKLIPKGEFKKTIELQEEYYVSDVHKNADNKKDESIDLNNLTPISSDKL